MGAARMTVVLPCLLSAWPKLLRRAAAHSPPPAVQWMPDLSYGDVYKDRNEADIRIIIVHLPRFRRRSSMGQ
jgi:hypothetical protein